MLKQIAVAMLVFEKPESVWQLPAAERTVSQLLATNEKQSKRTEKEGSAFPFSLLCRSGVLDKAQNVLSDVLRSFPRTHTNAQMGMVK